MEAPSPVISCLNSSVNTVSVHNATDNSHPSRGVS
jgi:hypothetical protein